MIVPITCDSPKEKVAIIGLGKAGTAMGHLLRRAGYPIVAVAGRSIPLLQERVRHTGGRVFAAMDVAQAASRANCIFITTPDDSIAEVCRQIATGQGFKPGDKVIHMSGSGGLDLLQPARDAGALTACIHPLQSFADVEGAIQNIPSSTFGITAVEGMRPWAVQLVLALGGIPLTIPEELKPLYHAAACMASNYLTTLMHMVEEIYYSMDFNKEEAFRAYWPLVLGTIRNIESRGTVAALTGPISRGDAGTIRQHLSVLREKLPRYLEAYRALGLETVELALVKRTLSPEQAKRIITTFKEAEP
jgi:predicted short-subunit dehydrogenase-like oxidoreductase (DUF2520 family)